MPHELFNASGVGGQAAFLSPGFRPGLLTLIRHPADRVVLNVHVSASVNLRAYTSTSFDLITNV
mgnify:CR=1